MRTRRLLVPLAALLLLGAGCGSGGSDGAEGEGEGLSSEEQAFADAWAATLSDDEDGFAAEPEDAACMGEAIMVELGTGPFDDAGVTPDDIDPDDDETNSPGELLGDGAVTEAQADAIIDTWQEDCVDLGALFSEGMGGDFDLDPEGKECFAEGLDADLARAMLRPSFTSQSEEPDAEALGSLLDLMDSCAGGEGSAILSSITQELAADGTMTEEEARCIAEGVLDTLGADRLAEISVAGDFEDADPTVQQEITGALIDAAVACDVPLTAFGG